MITELAAAAGLGLLLGIVTGMPIAVVNVAIVDAAVAGKRAFAIGIGVGGAIADTVHSGLAFVGVGRVITARPEWIRIAALVAAAVVVGYAVLSWRGRTRRAPARKHGIATGLLLTLPNPAALGAWIAVAALVWPQISTVGGLVVAAGVGLGSAAWFTTLARFVAAHRDAPILRIVPKIAIALLVVLAAAGVARAFG